MANGLFGGGTGTSGTPWLVEDAADLNAVRNSLGANYKQVANISLSGYAEWIPIGAIFSGTYDGNDYTVSNVTCTDSYTRTGLFATNSGSIFNLGVENVNYVSGSSYVGGLVGRNDGTITNCYSTGNVTGSNYVGGLVGRNYVSGTITNCYSTGNVTGSGSVGGLVGYNGYGAITNCYSTGNVTGSSYVGGLVGYNYGTIISNCYALNSYINRNNGAEAISFGDITGSGTATTSYSLDTMQFIQL